MRKMAAGLLTLAILAAAVWLGHRPQTPAPAITDQENTPLACVERMFQAAAAGDLNAYLHCFSGSERARLERSFGQESGATAAASLQATVADLKGWAIVDPPTNFDNGSCSLEVERIYAGRIDRQRMQLRKEVTDRVWLITAVERAQPAQPAIAYGTPVYEVGKAEKSGAGGP